MPKVDSAAHNRYGSADFEMIWDTATEDIPAVKEFCQDYLSNN